MQPCAARCCKVAHAQMCGVRLANRCRHVPAFIRESVPRSLYAHTSEPIDFGALKGKRVAILGGAGRCALLHLVGAWHSIASWWCCCWPQRAAKGAGAAWRQTQQPGQLQLLLLALSPLLPQ